MARYEGNDRRQYVRIPFQKNINYRLCYEKFAATIMEADASNLSQNGICFKTKYPPPTTSVISIQVDTKRLKDYLQKENLMDVIDPEQLYTKGGNIYGEVVRIIKDSQSGFHSVAVKLILKKDPTAEEKIEEAKLKDHPQYIDPSKVPDEEKFGQKEEKPSHPQYIDPDKAPEE